MSEIRSPFKFLDAYSLEDKDHFFGRDEEIARLYQMVFESNLLLIYGPSGSGKTSLVQCGLASKFEETDWFDIFVRRRGDINRSFQKEVKKHIVTPVAAGAPLTKVIESLFLDHFKPIYLIFDQFEELYILGDREERKRFIEEIIQIIKADINCKVLLVMREEYIARLYDFEKELPAVFDHRIRIEPMNYSNVVKVIKGSAEKFNIELKDPDTTIEEIFENISEGRSGVQLSYLQIYLDKLYRESFQN